MRVFLKPYSDENAVPRSRSHRGLVNGGVKASVNATARRAANDILRGIDHLIKSGDIYQAIREIIRAKEADPTNGYVYAYEERLAYLKSEYEKNIEWQRTKREVEEAARCRDAALCRIAENEDAKHGDDGANEVTDSYRLGSCASERRLSKSNNLRFQDLLRRTKVPKDASSERASGQEEVRDTREISAKILPRIGPRVISSPARPAQETEQLPTRPSPIH